MISVKKTKSLIMFVVVLMISLLVVGCSSNKTKDNTKAVSNKSDYPNKSIEWVIPFSPGSGADVFARELAKIMGQNIGQTMVATNKPGGSTSSGVNYVLGKPADGYTLFNNSSTLSLYLGKSLVDGNPPFSVDKIKPVYRIDGLPILLVVPSDSPYKSVDDFVKYAKANPKKLKIGGAGKYSTQHYAALNFEDVSKVKFAWVPFDGGADSVVALLGKNLDGIFTTYDNVKQHIASGKLKPLAVASDKRQISPDIPTFKELGYNIEVVLWRGIFVPSGVPDEVVTKLEEAIDKSLKTPEWEAFMKKFELQPFYAKSGEFSKFFKEEVSNAQTYFKDIQ